MMAAYRVQKQEEEDDDEAEGEGGEGGEGGGAGTGAGKWTVEQLDEQWYRVHVQSVVLCQACCRRYLDRRR